MTGLMGKTVNSTAKFACRESLPFQISHGKDQNILNGFKSFTSTTHTHFCCEAPTPLPFPFMITHWFIGVDVEKSGMKKLKLLLKDKCVFFIVLVVD